MKELGPGPTSLTTSKHTQLSALVVLGVGVVVGVSEGVDVGVSVGVGVCVLVID